MNQIIHEHNASNEPIEMYVLDEITVKECNLQSELEILLYREVLTLKNEKQSMFKTSGKLENEIDIIRKELKILQKKRGKKREKGIRINEEEKHSQDEYNKDEEHLEMDIEWCTQATRKYIKKKKASSSPKDDDELRLQSNSEEHLQDGYNTDIEQLERAIRWCTQATRKNKKKGKLATHQKKMMNDNYNQTVKDTAQTRM
jgi:hypothetical protein